MYVKGFKNSKYAYYQHNIKWYLIGSIYTIILWLASKR